MSDTLSIVKRNIKSKGFTLAQLAEKMPNRFGGIGITQPSMTMLLNGNPTIESLQDIANAMGITLAELLSDGSNSAKCPHCGGTIRVALYKG